MRADQLGPGLQTDLMLLRARADIRHLEDCVAVISPGNPDFYWGNFLALYAPPQAQDIARWRSRFAQLIAGHPGIAHESLTWVDAETDPRALAQWQAQGFRISHHAVLTCEPGQLCAPAKRLPDLVVRTATRPDVPALWRLYVRFAREQKGGPIPLAERRFLRAYFLDFMRLVEAGLGHWHVACWRGQVVAALGLFSEEGTGRYQEVLTDSRFRNRGIAAALVHEVSHRAFTRGLRRLVMVADTAHHALEVYRRLGFRPFHRVVTACRPPGH